MVPQKSPKNPKIWMIASAILLCTTLLFGVSSLSHNQAGGADMKGTVDSLTVVNGKLKKQISDLQSKEKNVNQSTGSLQKQVTDLKAQVSSQTNRINSLQKENTSLKSDVNKYKAEAEKNETDARRWRRHVEANSK